MVQDQTVQVLEFCSNTPQLSQIVDLQFEHSQLFSHNKKKFPPKNKMKRNKIRSVERTTNNEGLKQE